MQLRYIQLNTVTDQLVGPKHSMHSKKSSYRPNPYLKTKFRIESREAKSSSRLKTLRLPVLAMIS